MPTKAGERRRDDDDVRALLELRTRELETRTRELVEANAALQEEIEERRYAMEALHARTAEMAALLEANRAIASSLDYDEVLRRVARTAGETLGSPECIIWEYTPAGDMAEFRCLWEKNPKPGVAESLEGSAHPIRLYSGGLEALRTGAVRQESYSDPSLSDDDRRDMEEQGEKTWLTVPLIYTGDLLGVMVVIETAEERLFTPDEVRMARALGEQAALALGNARLHRRAEEHNRWLNTLVATGRRIASSLDLTELLDDVARLGAQALRVPLAFIYEYEAEGVAWVARSRHGVAGIGRDDPAGSSAPASETLHERRTLLEGGAFVHTVSDPALPDAVRRRMVQDGEKTLVTVPFRFQDRILGKMVLVETAAERTFTANELEFMRSFGEQVAIALNNARLYATIEAQATTDGLTGLANHRTFYDRLDQELARARRYRTPVSLLMIDIDDFKKLNDTHGHRAGDEVLRLMGRILLGRLRRGVDLPARYGGEEFAVMLPDTPLDGAGASEEQAGPADGDADAPHLEGAAALAERLRALVADTPFSLKKVDAPVAVTVSIGVAEFPASAGTMDELVARADAALYEAKRAGKDRVRVFSA